MEIVIRSVEDAEILRKMLHKISDNGIDDICDTIVKSLKLKETSNVFLLNKHTLRLE